VNLTIEHRRRGLRTVSTIDGREGEFAKHAGAAPRFLSTAYIVLTFFLKEKCKHEKRRAPLGDPIITL
jgi:hypothetical protein